MEYQSPDEIFPLFKDEFNSRMAEKVYNFITDNFEEAKIVSLRSCISLAVDDDNSRKFASITPEEGNALLLHYPLDLRDKVKSANNKFEKSKRYGNQINIKLKDINDVNNLKELIELAYNNPRKIKMMK